MNPVKFIEANCMFGPPPELDESQCRTIHAYKGIAEGGSVDGSIQVVVAWQPTDEERQLIAAGQPIFVSMLGGLAPHFLTLDFHAATHPA